MAKLRAGMSPVVKRGKGCCHGLVDAGGIAARIGADDIVPVGRVAVGRNVGIGDPVAAYEMCEIHESLPCLHDCRRCGGHILQQRNYGIPNSGKRKAARVL